MVKNEDGLWMSSEETMQALGVTMNNLRQIQHRGTLKWGMRLRQRVYYEAEAVERYAVKRRERTQKHDAPSPQSA